MWKLWKCINLYRVQEGALSYSCYFVSSKKRKEKKKNKCIGKLKMLEVLFWKVLWRGSSFSWILTKTRDTESIGGAFHECTLESCQYFVIRCCHQQVAGCCPSVNTFFFSKACHYWATFKDTGFTREDEPKQVVALWKCLLCRRLGGVYSKEGIKWLLGGT